MAAGSTYSTIATTTLGSSTTTVTFSSIPGTYTDLVLVVRADTASGGDDMRINVNGDSGTNYSTTQFQGNGTIATSTRRSNFTYAFADNAYPATTGGFNSIVNFMNYSNSTTYKTMLMRANRADSATGATVALWRNTNPITQIVLTITNGLSFASGSTLTLYGITAA